MSGPPEFDWKKLATPENRPKLIVAGVALLLLVLASSWSNFGPSGGLLSSMPGSGGGQGPVALNPLGAGQCRTFAPDGWSVAETNPNGTIFTTVSADRGMIAAYAGTAVNGATAQGIMQEAVPPDAFVQNAIAALTSAPVNVTSSGQNFGAYQVMQFQSGAYSGYALYYSFAVPADPSGYGIIVRIAAGGDAHAVATAGSVAAATRCQAIVIPQNIGGNTDRDTGHGTGTSKNCAEGNCDDGDLAGTYNAQLGTGWVHDSTGRNYNVDVTADYRENGPDGPGYYKANGNDLEKLQPGLE